MNIVSSIDAMIADLLIICESDKLEVVPNARYLLD